MSVATITRSASVIGKTIRKIVSAEDTGYVVQDPTLAAAKTGTLTTRTDNNTGTLTMAPGHGITTGQRLDVYWTDPTTGLAMCQYGVTAGTVATNSVPIDLGVGDNLPLVNTAVTVMVPTNYPFTVTAANLSSLLVGCASRAMVVFMSSVPAVVKACLVDQDRGYLWDDSDEATTPFGANVATVYISHGYSGGERQVNAVALV
jgi:hypothetical protein